MKKAYSLVNTAKAKDQEAVQSIYLKVSVILGVVGERWLRFSVRCSLCCKKSEGFEVVLLRTGRRSK